MAAQYSTQNLNNLLTNFATLTMGEGGPNIGERLFPVVYTPISAFKYRIFSGKEAIWDNYDVERAPKGKSNEIERVYTSTTGATKQYGLRELIADEEYDNADSPLDIERDATSVIVGKLRTIMEQEAITLAVGDGWSNKAAGSKWDSGTANVIEKDIEAAKLSVLKKSGQHATTMLVPYTIASKAKYQSEIRDLMKYTHSDLLEKTGTLPAKMFGLDVIVSSRIQNEANPGTATASYDFIMDDFDAWVGYVNPSPSMRSMGAGYTFRRKIAGKHEIAMFKYRDDDRHGNWIEGLIEQTIVEVTDGAGYQIQDIDD